MVVPTAWWHATCNLGAFTLGIGGQDSCDMVDCTPAGPADETEFELHMRKQFCRDDSRGARCFADEFQSARRARQRQRWAVEWARTRTWTLAAERWLEPEIVDEIASASGGDDH